MAALGSGPACVLVPRAPLPAGPLEDREVAALGSSLAGVLVPWAPVLPRPLKELGPLDDCRHPSGCHGLHGPPRLEHGGAREGECEPVVLGDAFTYIAEYIQRKVGDECVGVHFSLHDPEAEGVGVGMLYWLVAWRARMSKMTRVRLNSCSNTKHST